MSTPAPAMANDAWFRRQENELCEALAQREGDRLLKVGDRAGAEVAHRIAAIIRIRRDQMLEAF